MWLIMVNNLNYWTCMWLAALERKQSENVQANIVCPSNPALDAPNGNG